MKIITLSIVVKERSNVPMFFIFEHGAEYSDECSVESGTSQYFTYSLLKDMINPCSCLLKKVNFSINTNNE